MINCIAELGNFRSGWLAPSIHFEEDKLCPDAIPLRLCDILDICYIQSKGGFVTVPGKEQNDKREKQINCELYLRYTGSFFTFSDVASTYMITFLNHVRLVRITIHT